MLATMFSFFTYLLHLQSVSSLSNNHPHNNAIKRISVSTWTRPNHDLYVLHQTPETPEHEHKYDTKYDTKYDIEHDQDALNKFNKNLDKRDMHKEVKNMYMLLKKLKMKQDRMERDVENHTNNHTNNHTQVHDNTKHN